MIITWLVFRSSFRPAKGLIRDLSAWQTRWASRLNLLLLANGTLGVMPNEFAKHKGLWWVPLPVRNELRKISHEANKIACKIEVKCMEFEVFVCKPIVIVWTFSEIVGNFRIFLRKCQRYSALLRKMFERLLNCSSITVGNSSVAP